MRTRHLAAGFAIALTMAACGDAASTVTTSETSTVPGTGSAAPTTPTAGSAAPPTTAALPSTAPVITSTTSEPSRADTVIEIRVADGVVTAPGRPEVELGSTVLLLVTADVADEVHVHGYDHFVDVSPGTPAELEFVADIPGIFEVELENGRTVLFELVVR